MWVRKDYWRMSDDDLGALARKYNVYTGKLAYVGSGGPQTVMDRDVVIGKLVARDAARHANVSVMAAIITIMATLFNVFWTLWHAK